MKKSILRYWENGIDGAIENCDEPITVDIDELKQECIETLKYYHGNDEFGCSINFKVLLLDVLETMQA